MRESPPGLPPSRPPDSEPRVGSGGRLRRFTAGAAATLLTQVINTAGQLVLVPVFVSQWGQGLYGEWLVLSAAVAYLTAVDLGVQTYAVNRLTQAYARHSWAEYTRVLQSALFWSLVVSGGVLALLIPALLLCPLHRWFDLTLTGARAAGWIAALLAIQVVGSVPLGLVGGIYRSIGEYPRGRMVANAQRLAYFGCTAAAVLVGAGLPGVALVQLAPLVLGSAYAVVDLRRRHPEVQIGLSDRSFGLALSFLTPSALFFVIQASIGVSVQGSTLLVGAMLGSASVAIFVTHRTLANLIRQLTGSLANSLWPELTMLEARRELATIRRVHLLAVKGTLALCIAAGVFLHFAARDLYGVWTLRALEFDGHLMDALLLLLVSQTPWIASSTLLTASNRHRMLAGCYGASTVVGLGLGALLLRAHGLAGFVLGLWIADAAICSTLVPWACCRLIGESVWHYAGQIALRGLAAAAFVFGTAWATDRVLADAAPIERLIALTATVVAATAAAGAAWLGAAGRHLARQLLWRARGGAPQIRGR